MGRRGAGFVVDPVISSSFTLTGGSVNIDPRYCERSLDQRLADVREHLLLHVVELRCAEPAFPSSTTW
jgi:hypothetical protein